MTAKKVTNSSSARKVAIVGSASSSVHQTPWEDRSFDIWGLAWRLDLQRVTAVFDIHSLNEQQRNVPEHYKEILAKVGFDVYLKEPSDDLPNAKIYPIEAAQQFLKQYHPRHETKYFASSIAYMFVFAILQNYDEIHFYGVDLLDNTEYGHQRPNLEFLIGVARGLGITVYMPEESALCRFPYMYGYEHAPAIGLVTPVMLRDRIKQYQEKSEKCMAEAYTADGAKQEARQLLQLLEFHERGGAGL